MTPAAMRIQMRRLLNWPRIIWSGLMRFAFLQFVRAAGRKTLRRFLRRESIRRRSKLASTSSADWLCQALLFGCAAMIGAVVMR